MPSEAKQGSSSSKKKQPTLDAMWGAKGKAKEEKLKDDKVDEGADDEDEASEVEASDEEEGSSSKKQPLPEDSPLPPISDLPSIFADIVSRTPQILEVAKHIQGRKLRVATMCSGTESPLLALNLIRRAMMDQSGLDLDIEHVFSCEIVPYKQAYIERNFRPPLLFRDVCELGDDEAHTAYGAKAVVPGNVDILVAGTSCVDYSNLNNEKKDIEDGGESGRTFFGMRAWVAKHRPPIVILENVCGAPWPDVEKRFAKIGYSATSLRLDTKQYYIPHTRQRGYLIAVDLKSTNKPKMWKEMVQKLSRPASASLDAFLLPSDDPRIHQAREKLVEESYNGSGRRTGRTDWGRCESRHQRTRLEENLGARRPLTNWDEGGSCKMLDFGWADWVQGQVERVWDLMDIMILQSAVMGVDPSYKTQIWNLSQNVDRQQGTRNKLGICPCLTPSMIPYITNRGGPMIGLEALHMQGLPINELLLTRESEDQLADLAGNAMSTTVVGTAIMTALIVCQDLLISSDEKTTYEEKHNHGRIEEVDEDAAMDVDGTLQSVEDCISGEEQLLEAPFDLSKTAEHSLSQLLTDAMRSVRLCDCEGRKDMTSRELRRCADCGWTSCVKCGGRPEHNYEVLDFEALPRLSPSAFTRGLKAALPMRVALSSVTEAFMDGLREQSGTKTSSKIWSAWKSAVVDATKSDLRFVELKRQELWSAHYESSNARLELVLHPQRPEWLFFAKAAASEPANAEIRKILMSPAGRLACDGALFSGQWEFALPHTGEIEITIKGAGELVPSWEAKLGLQAPKFKDRMVHSQLEIEVPEENEALFDRSIAGTYTLSDKCGTASSALHKKASTEEDKHLPPLFMLIDPSRCGKTENDGFVFAINTRRYEYGEARPLVARLDPSWRQSDKDEQTVKCQVPQKYVAAVNVSLQPSLGQEATFAVPKGNLDIVVNKDACQTANALLVARFPLGNQAGPEWPRGTWKEVEPIHARSTFRSLSWLIERIKDIEGGFHDWQEVALPDDHSNCERCAPHAPGLRWITQGKKVAALEDSIQAGEYERRLKRRPAPFVTQLKLDEDGTGIVRIGMNVPSLIHRALSRLPSNRTAAPVLSWRLETDFQPLVKLILPKFTLLSNRSDPEHAQPPHFTKNPLRPEQLRSLDWMIKQEDRDASPFIEEEISEAILEPLGWRVEGRAQKPVHIRGGVLADQVGYGKTAITLGLIDWTRKAVSKELSKAPEIPGKIRVKASLIVVPPHLTRQWGSEIKKFIRSPSNEPYKVVTLTNASSLNSSTIEGIMEADIVIVASTLFKSAVYLDNLEAFAARGSIPRTEGRYFNARLDACLEGLREQVDRLRNKDEGATAVLKAIHEARKKDQEEIKEALRPSKRIRGIAKADESDEDEAPAPKPNAAAVKASGTSKAKGPAAKADGASPSSDRKNAAKFSHVEVRPVSSIYKKSPKTVNDAQSSSAGDAGSGDDSEPIMPRKRKASAKVTYVLDSDEEEAPAKKKGKGKAVKKPVKSSRSSSPDYQPSDDKGSPEEVDEEADDDDDDVFNDSDEESDAPKSKSKAKPKTKAKPAKGKGKAKSKKSDSEDAMDVDDGASTSATSSSGTSKKRKRTEEKEKKPKELREAKDPWKLKTDARREWQDMRSPPLEMFHFARKVVDEYTYLDGLVHSAVTKLTADRHWVLSGTPPVHDFAAVKTIAAFLDVHLGIDDDGEGQSAQIKKRRRDQTAAEHFHSFRETHSLDWHAHRHEVGQTFLNRFVRQNIAEIDEIPWEDKAQKVVLPAAERAIYLELEHHLRALDMTIKRGKKNESDREKRLAKSLGESRTAEEALLKRCSHFELDTSDKENAMKACEIIVKERTTQFEENKAELLTSLHEAIEQEKTIGRTDNESMFQEYVRVCRTEGVGDDDANEVVRKLLDEAGSTSFKPKKPAKASTTKAADKKKSKKEDKQANLIWEHREKTHHIRRLTKELVGRLRSLRYFTVVRDLQKQDREPPIISCPSCERDQIPLDEIAVLSSCGHTGCLTCVKACASNEECVYAASGACKAAARALNIVKGSTLGVDDEERDGRGKHFGMKLENVIKLIQTKIPPEERVLLFVQFPDLTKKVAEALEDHKVKFLEIKGSASAKSKALEKVPGRLETPRLALERDGRERVRRQPHLREPRDLLVAAAYAVEGDLRRERDAGGRACEALRPEEARSHLAVLDDGDD
ncbi:hypothetical protein EWM64_g2645 [Hericium alpestre]|uniref:Helicase ATP-binding domain-containing protein n=1 Tax=Hericium alpestre TaxID=135208 RepID=A0A4Z0A4X5_9AGAM|nr:hypothetical protein EWM64_g2645 [Hericium alpestre]